MTVTMHFYFRQKLTTANRKYHCSKSETNHNDILVLCTTFWQPNEVINNFVKLNKITVTKNSKKDKL